MIHQLASLVKVAYVDKGRFLLDLWTDPHFTSHGANKPEMAKRLIPLLDRVLVEKIVAPTKSVGGILLPESAVSKVRDASRFRRFDAVSNNPKCRPRDPN